MSNECIKTLATLLGADFRVESGTYHEVYGPDGRHAGFYDEEISQIFSHARVFMEDCNDHSEHFILELGRSAIEERRDAIEARGFEITDEDGVATDESDQFECPVYSMGICRPVNSVEEAADVLRELATDPIELHVNAGL